MRLSNILAGGLMAALVGGAALAQAFPPQTFDQIIAADLQLIAQQRHALRPGDLFFNPNVDDNARTRTVFTGQSRPLDDRKHAFIVAFASTSTGNSTYASLFQREYLFKADGKDFWLPVQGQVAAYFAKELSSGTPVTLFLRNAGGYRLEKAWDWVFLVEDFQGGKPGQKPDAKPAPGAPKPFTPPPGPKTAT